MTSVQAAHETTISESLSQEPTTITMEAAEISSTPDPPADSSRISSSAHHKHHYHHDAQHPRLRNRTKTDDIFSRFTSSSPTFLSPSSTNQSSDTQSPEEQDSLSRIRTVVLTPLYLMSYLISMLYVARRNDSKRKSLSAAASFPHTTTKHQDGDTGVWAYSAGTLQARDQSGHVVVEETRGWFVSKKHRKVVGMEMSEAEEVHGVVLVGIVVLLSLASVGIVLGLWMYVRRTWLVS